MSDPRKLKKYYMKIFRSEDLYKEFLRLYDEAVKDKSAIPDDIAMIRFQDRYVETEDGWMER